MIRARRKKRLEPQKEKEPALPKAKVRVDPGLKSLFAMIGRPEESLFRPDPFQLEALEAIAQGDVMVCAPTGAGKTWIATQAIHRFLIENKRIWYATPLKALSNSIYEIFIQEFGANRCGILTGDRKENPEADVIVGTTEILRNQLYDAMFRGEDLRSDLVILDEAHYMNDLERGVVWEEVMIYLPPRVKLMLLSATISNPDELASWLFEVRGVPVKVIKSMERPVPLRLIFYSPEGWLTPFITKRGLHASVMRWDREREGKKGQKLELSFMLKVLRDFNLLPAIFFLKSREDCDRAVFSCPPTQGDEDIKHKIRQELEGFLRDYPHLRDHRQLPRLIQARVASHHAGQLPSWKLLVERMMNQGLLEAIFATTTVAAGVNFPARTVVILQSDRYNGREFLPLTATEFHQMIGRAGRRGKDTIGFALILPGPHMDPQLIKGLSKSPPEPIQSQLRINFSMVLNLLLSHTPGEIKYILERSFATYQYAGADHGAALENYLRLLKGIVEGGECASQGIFDILAGYDQYKELLRELDHTLKQGIERQLSARSRTFSFKGKIMEHKNGPRYFIVHEHLLNGKPVFVGLKLHGGGYQVLKAKRPRKLFLQEIRAFYEPAGSEEIRYKKGAIVIPPLKEMDLCQYQDHESSVKYETRKALLQSHRCHSCLNKSRCHEERKDVFAEIKTGVEYLKEKKGLVKEELWFEFDRHLIFLKETGFVDQNNRLTPEGFWASKLRLDYPLLIAELIRKGTLLELGPELLAGSLGLFVWDRGQGGIIKLKKGFAIREYEELYERILEDLLDLLDRLELKGFRIPQLQFWAGVAIYLWAKGVDWKVLLEMVRVDEGDMASLIVRTIDHLRQLTNLKDSHPSLAGAGERAIELLMREPVYMETALQ